MRTRFGFETKKYLPSRPSLKSTVFLVECNFVKLVALVYQIKKVLGKVQVCDDFVQVLNLPFVSFWSMFVWASNKSCPPLTPITSQLTSKFVSVCLDLKS